MFATKGETFRNNFKIERHATNAGTAPVMGEKTSQQKRKCIDAFLLSDLRKEISEEAFAAGINPEQLRLWLEHEMTEAIRGLPASGIFSEMFQDRHRNAGTAWRTNDLTDMVYLSCAAGYADFVVCERHMGSVLGQGLKRLGLRQNVFPRLCDAVPAIESALATTPSSDRCGPAVA